MAGNHDSVVSRGVMGLRTYGNLDRLQIVSVRSLRDKSTTQNHWTSLDSDHRQLRSQKRNSSVDSTLESDRHLGGFSHCGSVDTEMTSG